MHHSPESRSLVRTVSDITLQGLVAVSLLAASAPQDENRQPEAHEIVMDTDVAFTDHTRGEELSDFGSRLWEGISPQDQQCSAIKTDYDIEPTSHNIGKPHTEVIDGFKGVEKVRWDDLPNLSFMQLTQEAQGELAEAATLEEIARVASPLFQSLGLNLVINAGKDELRDTYTTHRLTDQDLPVIKHQVMQLMDAIGETPAEYIQTAHLKTVIIGSVLYEKGKEDGEWVVVGLYNRDNDGWMYISVSPENYKVGRTFGHELFHAYEKSDCKGIDSDFKDPEFRNLNPQNFSYGDESLTTKNADLAVVASNYGSTSPTEDKASIAEEFSVGDLVNADEQSIDTVLAQKEKALLSRIERDVPGYTRFVSTLTSRREVMSSYSES